MAEDHGTRIDVPIRFTRRPIPLAADYRPAWKISLLLLILQLSSRGGKSSLKRLHVLNWAIRSAQNRDDFLEAAGEDRAPLFSFRVRFEPAFARAIDFASAEKLISLETGDRAQITTAGVKYALLLLKQNTSMLEEVSFLKQIGKSVTEEKALKLVVGPGVA